MHFTQGPPPPLGLPRADIGRPERRRAAGSGPEQAPRRSGPARHYVGCRMETERAGVRSLLAEEADKQVLAA